MGCPVLKTKQTLDTLALHELFTLMYTPHPADSSVKALILGAGHEYRNRRNR